jgi:hypothetical protein
VWIGSGAILETVKKEEVRRLNLGWGIRYLDGISSFFFLTFHSLVSKFDINYFLLYPSKIKLNSVAWVHDRTIPTERLPLPIPYSLIIIQLSISQILTVVDLYRVATFSYFSNNMNWNTELKCSKISCLISIFPLVLRILCPQRMLWISVTLLVSGLQICDGNTVQNTGHCSCSLNNNCWINTGTVS